MVWIKYLISDGMKTNRVGNDLDNVMEVDNSWNDRRKHLLVSLIVFSSVGKKMFHPAASV